MTVTTQHDGDDAVRRSVLPGGLRIVTESLPAVRSAAVGIWASVGSRDEDLDHAGATHYLEHLLVKGTSKRTALEISAAMDAVGGELNALTRNEYTCSCGRVLAGGAAPTPPRLGRTDPRLAPGAGVRLVPRTIEQANLVLGCAGLSRTDSGRFALGVLNAALGGGMSSRLFQEVREKRGLAYSVYSFSSQHADTGLWGVYAGCLPAKADEVLSICRDESDKVVSGRLPHPALDRRPP